MRDLIRLAIGIRSGATRHAILVGSYAIKVPIVTSGWELFLCGLLGNIQESKFSGSDPVFCPIKFSFVGGFLNIMMRAKPMTDDEFEEHITDKFLNSHTMDLPVEIKASSFGWLEQKLVCVDYGS